jgi:arsenate reductase
MITIYHNPRCSKSRAALAMVEQFAAAHDVALDIVDYQKTPLTLPQLTALHRQGGLPVREMVRDNEEDYASLQLAQADDATLLRALSTHPHLLQRPIVTYGERTVIARPVERLQTLLVAP